MKNNFKTKKILIIANSNLFFKQHLYGLFKELNFNTKIYFVTKKDTSLNLKSKNISHISILIHRNPSLIDIFTLISYFIIRIRVRPVAKAVPLVMPGCRYRTRGV